MTTDSGHHVITIYSWSIKQEKLVTWAKRHLNLTIKPVSRPKASGFVVLPCRWVVERSLAWMMHARQHARDYERLVQHSETLITRAAITLPEPQWSPHRKLDEKGLVLQP